MNLLREVEIIAKITEICGSVPSNLWLDIAWERLCELVDYDLSLGTTKQAFNGGIDDRVLYLVKRPVVSIEKITFNNNEQSSNTYGIFKERGVNFKGIIPQNTAYPYGMSDICNLNEIIVEYTGGFTKDTFPNTLILVACDLIETLKSQVGEEGNLSAYRINDISYNWKSNAEINGKFNNILDNFRSF